MTKDKQAAIQADADADADADAKAQAEAAAKAEDDAGQIGLSAGPETEDGDSEKVYVEVKQTIGYYGVVIRPKIEGKRGRPSIITPVKAVIPRALAESYGGDYVKVLGPAPDDAKIGVVKEL